MVLNQYSLLVVVVGLLGVAALVLFRKKPRLTDLLAFTAIAASLLGTWFALRPTQTPSMNEAADVQKMIGAGKPVLLEFQSPY